MPRTTLDIDATVLRELKRRGRQQGKTLGQLASELLARELSRDRSGEQPAALAWTVRSLGGRVDLEDKDALHRALEGP